MLQGEGWHIGGLQAIIDIDESGRLQFTAQAAQLELADTMLQDIKLECTDVQLTSARVTCPQGTLGFSGKGLNKVSTPVSFTYHSDTKRIELHAASLSLAKGRVSLAFEQQADRWQLQSRLSRVDLTALSGWLKNFDISLPELKVQGRVNGDLELRGRDKHLQTVAWNLDALDIAYANVAGTQAGEQLAVHTTGIARPKQKRWLVDLQLQAKNGMLYTDPVYFEFKPKQALSVDGQVVWDAGEQTLRLTRMTLNHENITQANVSALIKTGKAASLSALTIDVEQAKLPDFYATYLQPWLAGNVWEKLETQGEIKGRVHWMDGELNVLHLDLKQVSLQAPDNLFAIEALNGLLQWDGSETSHESIMTWERAAYQQLGFGKARLHVLTSGSHLQMLEPLSIDMLDGRLHVDAFRADWSREAGVSWQLDAVLAPVSMQAFSKAVGWPELSGKLSGIVPKVHYSNQELTIGGTLLVQVFDGDITVRKLKIREPVGRVPRLWADASLEHLDLETLTRTFSFGRIEGKLQGAINGLYMEAWQPVAFDAHFETPPGDKSRRRISQKAVDSISNLGGSGVSGAVSRSFLRFLEDFPYQQLGIRCRLENHVCRMDGVAPANGGYYLVQGRTIPPRLDIVGYERQVDWKTLIDRLLAVTRNPSPVVH